MFRWIKLFGDWYIGFWVIGLFLFALQEIPYMLMPLFKLKSNPIMNMQEFSVILDVCEKVTGSLCIIIMTFLVREKASVFDIGQGVCRLGFVAAVVVLCLNYLGWGFYFHGYQTFGIMMFFIVALPPLYYVCIGLWRENLMLCMIGIVFEMIHFVHVYANLKI